MHELTTLLPSATKRTLVGALEPGRGNTDTSSEVMGAPSRSAAA